MDDDTMEDLTSLDLRHVRAYLTEVIAIYMESARDRSRGPDARLHAAQLAEKALFGYLKLIEQAEIVSELEQFQRILGSWRSSLPKLFED
jgi:hypothetical protein